MAALDAVRGRDEDGRLTHSVVAFEDVHPVEPSHATHTVDDAENVHASGPLETKQAKMATSVAKDAENPPPSYSAEHNNGSEAPFGINGLDDDSKELERNPDHVTQQAGVGQQKAEAAALVWNRPAVILIYTWSVPSDYPFKNSY